MSTIEIKVPATTANLGPGYDILGLALQKYLLIQAKPAAAWAIRFSGEGAKNVSTGNDNLLVHSYLHACTLAGWPAQAFELAVVNSIPFGRGLGSSAAATVAGIALAQLVHTGRIDRDELVQIATDQEGHGDNVAPAVFGGLIQVIGQSPTLQITRLPLSNRIRVQLIIPPTFSATAELRTVVPDTLSHSDQQFNERLVTDVITGLETADPTLLKSAQLDRRHQPFRFDVLPESAALFRLLGDHPLISGAFLSSAGSTVAGWVVENRDPSPDLRLQIPNENIRLELITPDLDGIQGEIR